MCGIAGIISNKKKLLPHLRAHLGVMNQIQAHRGPDGEGIWSHPKKHIGFGHKRLSIIDLDTGQQPMSDHYGNTICHNGEIYNYLELKEELNEYGFRSHSDTETILAAYWKWGEDCVNHLRGMFAFAIWDEKQQRLFCARDRFGIKPFYFCEINDVFYFASEAKALIPFLPEIKTNEEALKDYLVFQFCLGTKTMFEGIQELPPAYYLILKDGKHSISKYWEVYYELDFNHTPRYFEERLQELIHNSVRIHTRSDVPIGSYISGGVDSGIVASLASEHKNSTHENFLGFTGKFSVSEEYDESRYARALAHFRDITLHEVDITSQNFIDSIENIIYHLDYPVAGPGSFPQYHVSQLASQHRKVVLGGQGGDEIFGGYTRYLIAYFEQCIKAAINGTTQSGNFIVTYESIIPNLSALKKYQPLMQEFWKEGLFGELDERYFRLINRAPSLNGEIHWDSLGNYSPKEEFKKIFHGSNVNKESYFDSMTHFDFKTLLRALLHVEDRMSMAHSVESRVPFLDHHLIEFTATIPSDIKFKNGTLKRVLINAMKNSLPQEILNRKDKMGFPVPLNTWLQGDLKNFVHDIFNGSKLKNRPYFNQKEILKSLSKETKFGRKIWGLLSLEIWHQQFHDRHHYYRRMVNEAENITEYANKG